MGSDQKRSKYIYGMIISLLFAITLSSSVYAINSWTKQQEIVHEIADLARSLDLPEDNPIIVEAKRLWNEDYSINSDIMQDAPLYTDNDAVIIAKVMYRECGGIQSDTEKACIAWVILNRVDAGYSDSIAEVATAPMQFNYSANTPVSENLLSLSYDVLSRWDSEKKGETDVGRVLPSDYLWYNGDGAHNHFRNAYNGGNTWDYSLISPYNS